MKSFQSNDQTIELKWNNRAKRVFKEVTGFDAYIGKDGTGLNPVEYVSELAYACACGANEKFERLGYNHFNDNVFPDDESLKELYGAVGSEYTDALAKYVEILSEKK